MKAMRTFLVVAVFWAAQHGTVGAAGSRTFTGEYVWEDGNSRGPVEAVFTGTAAGRWDVSFSFTFDGRKHVYSGTAAGSLSDGELRGQVHTESRGRTFTFRGTFKDGRFRGTHAEVDDGEEHRTGTLTLHG